VDVAAVETKQESDSPRPFFVSPVSEVDGDPKITSSVTTTSITTAAAFEPNEEALEKAITSMVIARNQLQVDENQIESKPESAESILAELDEMKNIIDTITSLAEQSAGNAAAEALKTELMGQTNNDNINLLNVVGDVFIDQEVKEEEVPIMEMRNTNHDDTVVQQSHSSINGDQNVEVEMELETNFAYAHEDITQENTSTTATHKMNVEVEVEVEAIPLPQEHNNRKTNGVDNEELSGFIDAFESVLVTEVLTSDEVPTEYAHTQNPKVEVLSDAEFEFEASPTVSYAETGSSAQQADVINGDVGNGASFATVEVLSDDFDFDAQTKPLNSAASDVEETSEKDEKENVVITFTLRTLDVIFFVTEKALTVGLPGIFTAYRTLGKKTSAVKRNGLGKEGWDTLANIKNAQGRY
jgi:hypothetical protein